MLIHDFLSQAAKRWPEKMALITSSGQLSYSELDAQARSLASWLQESGFREGDRAVILADDRQATVVAMFGVLIAGGCFSIVSPSLRPPKLRYILSNSGARVLIAEGNKKATVDEAVAELAMPPLVIYTGNVPGYSDLDAIVKRPIHHTPKRPIDMALAAIIYTSGSTGEPKGVTMTHHNMVSAANSIAEYLELQSTDVILCVLPLSFDYGLYQVLLAAKTGATIVLRQSFGYPYEIVDAIRDHGITVLPCVPTMMALLLQLEHLERENLSTVRTITNTAAAMPPTFIPRLRSSFPNARIFSMYGLTECKRVSYVPPDMLDHKPNSVGIPMPNVEVWIADQDGNALPAGEVGELVVRGSNVMQGYWSDPEETARRLRPGRYPWETALYTGDLFRMDADGYLYFVARRDDMIKCRGERISPKEIENVLYSIPDVLLARVTGVPHEVLGQAIRAEIVLRHGSQFSAADIRRRCRDHLEPVMVPHTIELVAELPVGDSGKVLRRHVASRE